MCIIAVSRRGCAQPTLETLRTCYGNNPQGAGYMFARDGYVHISKGYMCWADFAIALRNEDFGPDDPVVYHFRISTQAGVNPQMCHPFPVTRKLADTRELEVVCRLGAAHNGIIPLTTDHRDRIYSDTAHYVSEYMAFFIRNKNDLVNPAIHQSIANTGTGKWAIMDGSGTIVTIGDFVEDRGVLFSNATYRPVNYRNIGGEKVFDNYSLFRDYRGMK